MSLFEVVLNTQYLEQQFINRWNYIDDDSDDDNNSAFYLARALGLYVSGDPEIFPVGTMGAAIQGLLNEQCIFVQAFVKNVYNPLDFYDYVFVDGIVGGNAGVGVSPVMAIGFTSTRTRLDIRRGQKRFSGIDGDFFANGGALSASAVTAANTLATRMSEDVTFDSDPVMETFYPVIVSKQKLVDSEGKVTYQYYPTLAQQMEHVAEGIIWSPKLDVRTQGSRQYLRGI